MRKADLEGEKFLFYCPGCECHMWFRTERPEQADGSGCWTWNGDYEKPTVSPSIVTNVGKLRCHIFIRDGKIEFLSDCSHELAGQTVPMEPIEW